MQSTNQNTANQHGQNRAQDEANAAFNPTTRAAIADADATVRPNQQPYETTNINPNQGQTTTTGDYNTGMNTNTGAQSFDHDQSTVHSPTQEHFSEKRYQGSEAAVAPGTTTSKKTGMARFTSNKLFTWGLRSLQLIFVTITLALACRSLNTFIRNEQRMRFAVFCGSITLLYFIILFILSFFLPSFLSAGFVIICEIILWIFWLSAFIAVAALYAGFSCSRSELVFPTSTDSSFIPANAPTSKVSGCRCAKAVPAFAAISFLLFLISSMLVWYNVIRRLRQKSTKPAYVFNPNATSSKTGYLDKSGLAFQKGYDPVTGTTNPTGYSYNEYDTGTTNPPVADSGNVYNPNTFSTTENTGTNLNQYGGSNVNPNADVDPNANVNPNFQGNIDPNTSSRVDTEGNIERSRETYQRPSMV